jgi:hypothetical protein
LEIEKHKYISALEMFNLNPKINKLMSKIIVIQNYPIDSILVNKDRLASIEMVSSFYKPDVDLVISISTYRDINYIKLLYNDELYTAQNLDNIGNKFLRMFQYLIDNISTHVTAEMLCNVTKGNENR